MSSLNKNETRLAGALKTVALIEAAKGVLVLLAGCGLLSLIHHDVQHFAEHLVRRAHLNPAAHYPHIFLALADKLTDAHLLLLAAGAGGYSLLRLVEAYGLWHARRWAEWLAALSGSFYIPFEIYELHKHASWLTVGSLMLNIAVVTFMLYCMLRKKSRAAFA